jgi:LPS sulfotransferase NodH
MKVLFDQYKELRQFGVIKELFKKCQFIWLLRRDVVAQAVSLYIARETNEWTSLNQESNYQKEQFNRRELVQYNEEQIAKFLNKIEKDNLKWLEFFAINEIEYLQMYYENILIDPNICRDICKLCKVKSEYNFSLQKTSFQKQGDILNEKLSAMFRENSIMNLHKKNEIKEMNFKNVKLYSCS